MNTEDSSLQSTRGLLFSSAPSVPGDGSTTPGGGTGSEVPGEGSTAPEGAFPASERAGTLTCGPESATVTEAMLAFSDANRAAVAAGQAPQVWSGEGPAIAWSFIHVDTYSNGTNAREAASDNTQDKFFVFTNSATLDGALQSNSGNAQLLIEGIEYLEDGNIPGVGSNTAGVNAFVISDLDMSEASATFSSNFASNCSYAKFTDGKLHSSAGAPAHYSESSYGPDRNFSASFANYATNGLPMYGTDRPSSIAKYPNYTEEVYYLASNGERWEYADKTRATRWHPDHKTRTISGESKVISSWGNLFGETIGDEATSQDKAVRLSNPVVEKRIMNPAENALSEDVTDYYWYVVPTPASNGADKISVAKRANGSIKVKNYTVLDSSGEEVGHRTDGPALYREYADGRVETKYYSINGKSDLYKKVDYEAAGGTNWSGMIEDGEKPFYSVD